MVIIAIKVYTHYEYYVSKSIVSDHKRKNISYDKLLINLYYFFFQFFIKL